jgi:very-short-patch-repair endonuclease
METDRRLIAFARQMRHEPPPTEKLMWRLLRHRRLAGFRFRRQHPIPPYIADYYCAVARLVVELDGESHLGNEEADRVRHGFFESLGLRVLRFWNTQVFDDQEAVLEAVYRACVERVREDPRFASRLSEGGQFTPHPRPLSPAGRGGKKGGRGRRERDTRV